MKLSYIFAYLSFYVLGAYATTDIPRLLKGATINHWNTNCYCPNCNHPLSLREQLPIFSYLFSHGKCKYCSKKIPLINLIPEIGFFAFFSITATLCHFSMSSLLFIIIIYELIKFLNIWYYGKRTLNFMHNLVPSLAENTILFGFLSFIFLVCQIS